MFHPDLCTFIKSRTLMCALDVVPYVTMRTMFAYPASASDPAREKCLVLK